MWLLRTVCMTYKTTVYCCVVCCQTFWSSRLGVNHSDLSLTWRTLDGDINKLSVHHMIYLFSTWERCLVSHRSTREQESNLLFGKDPQSPSLSQAEISLVSVTGDRWLDRPACQELSSTHICCLTGSQRRRKKDLGSSLQNDKDREGMRVKETGGGVNMITEEAEHRAGDKQETEKEKPQVKRMWITSWISKQPEWKTTNSMCDSN